MRKKKKSISNQYVKCDVECRMPCRTKKQQHFFQSKCYKLTWVDCIAFGCQFWQHKVWALNAFNLFFNALFPLPINGMKIKSFLIIS